MSIAAVYPVPSEAEWMDQGELFVGGELATASDTPATWMRREEEHWSESPPAAAPASAPTAGQDLTPSLAGATSSEPTFVNQSETAAWASAHDLLLRAVGRLQSEITSQQQDSTLGELTNFGHLPFRTELEAIQVGLGSIPLRTGHAKRNETDERPPEPKRY